MNQYLKNTLRILKGLSKEYKKAPNDRAIKEKITRYSKMAATLKVDDDIIRHIMRGNDDSTKEKKTP